MKFPFSRKIKQNARARGREGEYNIKNFKPNEKDVCLFDTPGHPGL